MIDIEHVSYQYTGAEKENLTDFTLHIRKGECVVLTGESGCGKTCVTRLVNALIPHFYEGELRGNIRINGMDTSAIQPYDLSDMIGSVFQNPRSQFFSLDTDSEIVFGMENKGVSYSQMKKRYQQTIQELHIEKLQGRDLFSLSGGQKQTIAFASVYALNPDIFVLDEPSSNLDPEAIQELRRLLLLIKAQGKTILVSEHRLYFLNGIADRIVLMEQGRLKKQWTAQEFERIPENEYQSFGLRSYIPMQMSLPEILPEKEGMPAVAKQRNRYFLIKFRYLDNFFSVVLYSRYLKKRRRDLCRKILFAPAVDGTVIWKGRTAAEGRNTAAPGKCRSSRENIGIRKCMRPMILRRISMTI